MMCETGWFTWALWMMYCVALSCPPWGIAHAGSCVTQSRVHVKSWEVAPASTQHTWDCSYTVPGAWSLSAQEKWEEVGVRGGGVIKGRYQQHGHHRLTPMQLVSGSQHHISVLFMKPSGKGQAGSHCKCADRDRADRGRLQVKLVLPVCWSAPPPPIASSHKTERGGWMVFVEKRHYCVLPNNADHLPNTTDKSSSSSYRLE